MAEIAGLEGSMSRRGNCHNNAAVLFPLLKRERIKKRFTNDLRSARAIPAIQPK